MRLVDLEPRWATAVAGRTGMGVTFRCPHCLKQRLVVAFANPIDGGDASAWDHTHRDGTEQRAEPKWQRTGDTFETLTLSPSVNVALCGHWHGFITNGEVRL